jgi:hypothetical protein
MLKKLQEETKIIKNMSFYWDNDDNRFHNIVKEEFSIYNSDYNIIFINKDEIIEFLYRHKYITLSDNFLKFNVYSVRSDISRIVQLFLYGGFYADSHIKFLSSLNNIKYNTQHNQYNINSKSYLVKKPKTLGISLMYSDPRQDLLLDVLHCINLQINKIINSKKNKAGQYTKFMHLSSADAMYKFFDKNGEFVTLKNKLTPLNKYFRFFEDNTVYKFYGNKKIVTESNTRLGNKHWSVLANEMDFI